MKFTIDPEEILTEASKKSDRKATTLWISEVVYKKFQVDCDKVPPSNVVEAFMKKFSETKRSADTKSSKK